MKLRLGIVAIVLALVGYFAYNEFAPIKPFLTNMQVAEALQIDETQIKEVYELTEYYRYVAYVQNDSPKMSLWHFENRKWRSLQNAIAHEIVMLDLDDEGQYFIWHFNGENMDSLNLYAIHDRNYEMTFDDTGTIAGSYFPQIFLNHKQQIEQASSHGIFQIPKQWQAALMRYPQFNSFNFGHYIESPIYGWDVLDENGERVEAIEMTNTGSYTIIEPDYTLHYVSRLEESFLKEH